MATLSEKREEVWFWGFFAALGIVLGVIGWLRCFLRRVVNLPLPRT